MASNRQQANDYSGRRCICESPGTDLLDIMLIFSTVVPNSAAELGTDIDIGSHVEVRQLKKEARGTVRWLGVCDDIPAVYLEMVSTVYPL